MPGGFSYIPCLIVFIILRFSVVVKRYFYIFFNIFLLKSLYIYANIREKEKEETQMLKYKFEVIEEFKKAGYPVQKIQKDKLLSRSSCTSLKKGDPVAMRSINAVCCMLRCQPGDLLEWVPTDDEKILYFK